jgi:hypothetical protein
MRAVPLAYGLDRGGRIAHHLDEAAAFAPFPADAVDRHALNARDVDLALRAISAV